MKAFIFDLDGVLISTDKYHYLAWKQMTEECNIPFDKQINDQLRGISRLASLDIILKHAGVSLSEKDRYALAERKNSYYQSYLQSLTPQHVTPVVVQTLATLKKRGYRLAVGSSSKNARFILTRIGLLKEFDAISDGCNIKHSKPDPEVFLRAVEYLNLLAEECYVVEDAVAGIEAGKAAGTVTIAIGVAAKAGVADYSVSDFSQLLSIIEEG